MPATAKNAQGRPARAVRWLLVLSALAATSALSILAPIYFTAGSAPGSRDRARARTARSTAPTAVSTAPTPTRTLGTTGTDPREAGRAVTFAEVLGQLVELGVTATQAIEDGDMPSAQAAQRHADTELDRLQRLVHSPAEKALVALGGLQAEDETTSTLVRRTVCLRLVADGLRDHHRAFQSSGERHALDRLVASILETLPRDEPTATALSRLLVHTPYLGLAHENPVLDLAAAADDAEFLTPIAAELLASLWHNLERTATRSSTELSGLAMLFTGSANPSRRLAALRHLLVAREGRYRGIVMGAVLERRDVGVARALAMAAALTLAAEEALGVLEQLHPLAGDALLSAFVALGQRGSAALCRAYEHHRARGTRAPLRAQMISGAGMVGDSRGIELAERALAGDPASEVRMRAVFVLTACAAVSRGEAALMRALDDRVLGRDPARLDQLALALENLVPRGATNAIDRVGRRLLGRAELTATTRHAVEALLERALPRRSGR